MTSITLCWIALGEKCSKSSLRKYIGNGLSITFQAMIYIFLFYARYVFFAVCVLRTKNKNEAVVSSR